MDSSTSAYYLGKYSGKVYRVSQDRARHTDRTPIGNQPERHRSSSLDRSQKRGQARRTTDWRGYSTTGSPTTTTVVHGTNGSSPVAASHQPCGHSRSSSYDGCPKPSPALPSTSTSTRRSGGQKLSPRNVLSRSSEFRDQLRRHTNQRASPLPEGPLRSSGPELAPQSYRTQLSPQPSFSTTNSTANLATFPKRPLQRYGSTPNLLGAEKHRVFGGWDLAPEEGQERLRVKFHIPTFEEFKEMRRKNCLRTGNQPKVANIGASIIEADLANAGGWPVGNDDFHSNGIVSNPDSSVTCGIPNQTKVKRSLPVIKRSNSPFTAHPGDDAGINQGLKVGQDNRREAVLPYSGNSSAAAAAGKTHIRPEMIRSFMRDKLRQKAKSTSGPSDQMSPAHRIRKSSISGTVSTNRLLKESRQITEDLNKTILRRSRSNSDHIGNLNQGHGRRLHKSELGLEQQGFFQHSIDDEMMSVQEDNKDRSGIKSGYSSLDQVVYSWYEDELKQDGNGDGGHSTRNRSSKNRNSNVSTTSADSGVIGGHDDHLADLETEKLDMDKLIGGTGVTRADSGVGSETAEHPKNNQMLQQEEEEACEDCGLPINEDSPREENLSLPSSLLCRKCEKKQTERKAAITEIVETELSYGEDLKLLDIEFITPISNAGLLTDEQLSMVFMNLKELVAVNDRLADRLQDALELAADQGDEDYTTVNVGKLFLESTEMFSEFETYCINQAAAASLLKQLESEKELLKIFLQVAQTEKPALRRMHLKSFLVIPVQRITKYPLLLNRVLKSTPADHPDVESIQEALQKLEYHLEQINRNTKGAAAGLKTKKRRSSITSTISTSDLKRLCLESLGWSGREEREARFVTIGRLQYTQPSEQFWQRVIRSELKLTPAHAVLVSQGKVGSDLLEDEDGRHLLFPKVNPAEQRAIAALLLVKDKPGSRPSLLREPLYLDVCIVSTVDTEEDMFELFTLHNEAFIFKGENKDDCSQWVRYLQLESKDLGSWRRRRNAMANIMIDSMSERRT